VDFWFFINQFPALKKLENEARPQEGSGEECGREISRGKTKNPFPQKKQIFVLPSPY
jgi:hypothetical protein